MEEVRQTDEVEVPTEEVDTKVMKDVGSWSSKTFYMAGSTELFFPVIITNIVILLNLLLRVILSIMILLRHGNLNSQ
jgi:hypothetical protein